MQALLEAAVGDQPHDRHRHVKRDRQPGNLVALDLLLQEESVIVHTEDFTLPGHTAEIYAPAEGGAR